MEQSIKDFPTKELVEELSRREGVERIVAEPYQEEHIEIEGPAIVLVVVD